MSEMSKALGIEVASLQELGLLECISEGGASYARFNSPDDYEKFCRILHHGTCMDRLSSDEPVDKYVHPVALCVGLSRQGILVTRKSKGKNNGLGGKMSIDIGGHMDPDDRGDPMHCVAREFGEEALVYDQYGNIVDVRVDEETSIGTGNVDVNRVYESVDFTPLGVTYDGSNEFNPNYIGVWYAATPKDPDHTFAISPMNAEIFPYGNDVFVDAAADVSGWSGNVSLETAQHLLTASTEFEAANWPKMIMEYEMGRMKVMIGEA